jgi:hypothetical protein
MGGMFFGNTGRVEAHNAKTGDHMDIEMFAKTWRKKSSIKGCVKDG